MDDRTDPSPRPLPSEGERESHRRFAGVVHATDPPKISGRQPAILHLIQIDPCYYRQFVAQP